LSRGCDTLLMRGRRQRPYYWLGLAKKSAAESKDYFTRRPQKRLANQIDLAREES